MQKKNKLNLHIYGIHLLNPYKTVVSHLKLNESNTEFMIIGTRQQLSKINRNTLLVGSNRFESMTEARNLGVLFDCNFNFCNHIILLKQVV